METFLTVPKGTGALKPVRLRPWQRDLTAGMSGDPRPRQGLQSIPMGSGESALAAFLAAYALFADDAEGAQVLCVASDERQAGLVSDPTRRMVELNPLLVAHRARGAAGLRPELRRRRRAARPRPRTGRRRRGSSNSGVVTGVITRNVVDREERDGRLFWAVPPTREPSRLRVAVRHAPGARRAHGRDALREDRPGRWPP